MIAPGVLQEPTRLSRAMLMDCKTDDYSGENVGGEIHAQLSPDKIKALAFSVVRPGGQALLLDVNNQPLRWVSIEDAVKTGTAFLVEVGPTVLAIDADDAQQATRTQHLASALKVEGLEPVLVRSGRQDHLHLFCRIDDGRHGQWVATAKAAGLSVRQSIRPPGSPHRLGQPVELIDPRTAEETLKALTPARSGRVPKLSPRMADLLRNGRSSVERKKTRSEDIQAVAVGFQNGSYEFEDFSDALLDTRNRAGEKVQGDSEARRYLKRSWQEAERFCSEQPAITDREAALLAIDQVRSAA